MSTDGVESLWDRPDEINQVSKASQQVGKDWDDSALSDIEYDKHNPYSDLDHLKISMGTMLWKLQVEELDDTFTYHLSKLSRGYNDQGTDLTAYQDGKTKPVVEPLREAIVEKVLDTMTTALSRLPRPHRESLYKAQDPDKVIDDIKELITKSQNSEKKLPLDADKLTSSLNTISNLKGQDTDKLIKILLFVSEVSEYGLDLVKNAFAWYTGFLTRLCMKTSQSVAIAIEGKYLALLGTKLGISTVGPVHIPSPGSLDRLKRLLQPGSYQIKNILIPQLVVTNKARTSANIEPQIAQNLRTTHLLHIQGNGIRLITLLHKALSTHSYDNVSEFLKSSLCRQTKQSIETICHALRKYKDSVLYLYARLLDQSYLMDLSEPRNSYMCLYLMYIIEPDDTREDSIWDMAFLELPEHVKNSAKKLAKAAVDEISSDTSVQIKGSSHTGSYAAEAFTNTSGADARRHMKQLKELESKIRTRMYDKQLESLKDLGPADQLKMIREMMDAYKPVEESSQEGRDKLDRIGREITRKERELSRLGTLASKMDTRDRNAMIQRMEEVEEAKRLKQKEFDRELEILSKRQGHNVPFSYHGPSPGYMPPPKPTYVPPPPQPPPPSGAASSGYNPDDFNLL